MRDIQAVFLAGGATLLPGVRDAVAEYFGRKLRYELDPMHVVSLGASMAAARPRCAPLLTRRDRPDHKSVSSSPRLASMNSEP